MRRIDPWGLPIVLALALSAIQVATLYAGVAIPDGANLLSSLMISFSLVYWVVRDARRRRAVPCHEFGFLVVVFLPASLAWYVFWTRGWRGLLPLAGLLGLVVLPTLSAGVAWLMLR